MKILAKIRKFTQKQKAKSIYRRNKSTFLKEYQNSANSEFSFGPDHPILLDRYKQSGTGKGAYFYQDLVIARWIFERKPINHIDVGSRVDGFVAHVAVFMDIDVYDIRQLEPSDKRINFFQKDITDQHFAPDKVYDSISCLHALEHFGLGRYGDPISYDGYRTGFSNITKLMGPTSHFYFSVPISYNQRIEFDAHRIFSIPFLLQMFESFGLTINQFCYVDDSGQLVNDSSVFSSEASKTFGLKHGCGLFDLVRK